MFGQLMISAILWTTLATLVAQALSILFMWWLGLPPKKLAHEIEDVQNPAVGACFFIVSVIVSTFVSMVASGGFTTSPSYLEELGWAGGGVIIGVIYTWVVFMIAHRAMGRENNENVYQYMRRELVKEQNVSLAFFLGGLAFTPFIAVVYQII